MTVDVHTTIDSIMMYPNSNLRINLRFLDNIEKKTFSINQFELKSLPDGSLTIEPITQTIKIDDGELSE